MTTVKAVASSVAPAPQSTVARRSGADRLMRRLLVLDPDGPKQSILGTEKLFGRSLVISGIRCLVTYVLIPVFGAVFGLTGNLGPAIGLTIGIVSIAAVFYATRRFFASDHRYRWRYAAAAGAVLALLTVQAVIDLIDLAS